jgi:hypothetical protein
MSFGHTEEMILPDPVSFLTACEYQEVPLANALGDELFLALHLIMKGCPDYMGHLQSYHYEQESFVKDKNLTSLSNLKMKRLKNYGRVPSPEEIRTIVAECVTATIGHANYFIEEVKRKERKESKQGIIKSERDNTEVLKTISSLAVRYHGEQKRKALLEILRMPASKVGACFSFHLSDVLMSIAMRQFGIALLVVHDDDDDKKKRTWPFQTVNYLHVCGGGYFLPITFGLIHIEADGNVSILRKQGATEVKRGETREHCYVGYALDMKKDIRVEVNLIRGLFDVGYTAFAEYIVLPKRTEDTVLQNEDQRPSEYRHATYDYLKHARRAWDEYQEYLQDQERRERREQEDGQNHDARSNKGRGAATTMQSEDHGSGSRDTDTVPAEHKLESYSGVTDEERKSNRTWYHNDYERMWPSKPVFDDLQCKQVTIEQCLRLLGKPIRTRAECLQFFDTNARTEMEEVSSRTYRDIALAVHPDRIKKRVVNEEMIAQISARSASLKNAIEGLKEWHELAVHKENGEDKLWALKVKQLSFLESWDTDIRIGGTSETMNYVHYLRAKKTREEEEQRKRKKQQEGEARKQQEEGQQKTKSIPPLKKQKR